MNHEIEQLIRLVKPPVSPNINKSARYWQDLQQKIGTKIPDDYFQLSMIYGRGCFGDFNFHANSAIEEYTSSDFVRNYNDGLARWPMSCTIRQEMDGEELSLPVWPSTPGLFMIGDNCCSQWLGYYTVGAPNEWTVIVTCSSLCQFINTGMNLSSYLLKCHTSPDTHSIIMYTAEDVDASRLLFIPMPDADSKA